MHPGPGLFLTNDGRQFLHHRRHARSPGRSQRRSRGQQPIRALFRPHFPVPQSNGKSDRIRPTPGQIEYRSINRLVHPAKISGRLSQQRRLRIRSQWQFRSESTKPDFYRIFRCTHRLSTAHVAEKFQTMPQAAGTTPTSLEEDRLKGSKRAPQTGCHRVASALSAWFASHHR